MKNQFLNLDFIGFSASLLCAVHCAAVPFLLTLAPLAGLQLLGNPWLEYAIIIFSFVIASFSMIHGYRRHHHMKAPLAIVLIGFMFIGTGHTLGDEWLEIILTTLGATIVAIAHIVNWKYFQRSQLGYPERLEGKE